MAKKTGAVKKKVVKVDAQGMAHVHSTFNNVIITLTNAAGEVISWSSAGKWVSEVPKRIPLCSTDSGNGLCQSCIRYGTP